MVLGWYRWGKRVLRAEVGEKSSWDGLVGGGRKEGRVPRGLGEVQGSVGGSVHGLPGGGRVL